MWKETPDVLTNSRGTGTVWTKHLRGGTRQTERENRKLLKCLKLFHIIRTFRFLNTEPGGVTTVLMFDYTYSELRQ